MRLHYEDRGTGDAFVLLHGFTGSAEDWRGVIGELSRARRVVAPEHRGHGDSPHAEPYSFTQLVDDFAAFADALGLERFDLLGHSMGGSVAMRYTLAHPQRVRRLILMDTAAQGSGSPNEQLMAAAVIARERGMTALSSDQMEPERRRKFEAMDPAAFTALGTELGTQTSVLERLREITCPVTVLVGANDRPDLVTGAEAMAERIPGAKLIVIPDAAHSPQLENRTAWLAAVEDALSS